MKRTSSQDHIRANLSKGGNGRTINSSSEESMYIKTAKAISLEFAGVDLIREKLGQTYVTEVNGNPGTGVIDITGKNYFADLIKFIETKSKKDETVEAPMPNTDKEENQKQKNGEASIKTYRELLIKEKKGKLTYHEGGMLAFLKKKYYQI